MSTRGIIAVGTLTDWKGLYNHQASNPTDMVPVLFRHFTCEMSLGKTLKEIGDAILLFDEFSNYLKGGVCQYCGKIATEAHSISLELLDPTIPRANVAFPDPAGALHAHYSLDEVFESQWTQADLDPDDPSIEWLYVLEPDLALMHVFDLRQKGYPHVGDIDLNRAEPAQNVLEAIECGANYERCSHLAWAHFPEIDRTGPHARLSTAKYLGQEPFLDHSDACAFLIGKKRYLPAGGGISGAVATTEMLEVSRVDPAAWYASVTDGKRRMYKPVAIVIGGTKYAPYLDVTWVFPPTRLNSHETFRSNGGVSRQRPR